MAHRSSRNEPMKPGRRVPSRAAGPRAADPSSPRPSLSNPQPISSPRLFRDRPPNSALALCCLPEHHTRGGWRRLRSAAAAPRLWRRPVNKAVDATTPTASPGRARKRLGEARNRVETWIRRGGGAAGSPSPTPDLRTPPLPPVSPRYPARLPSPYPRTRFPVPRPLQTPSPPASRLRNPPLPPPLSPVLSRSPHPPTRPPKRERKMAPRSEAGSPKSCAHPRKH